MPQALREEFLLFRCRNHRAHKRPKKVRCTPKTNVLASAKPPSSSLGDKKLAIQSGEERLRTLNLSFTNIDAAACFFCWKLALYGWKSYVSSKEQTRAIFPIVPT
ncbi:hypothetical protein AVEN_33587-1 [Araneus ventricosus]|uniref:Uncharacterized protein n=1 Tax=Araneus ventricosus TaxID=182803 RepID=A0A4Y2RP22_ARAVE|nr:hypothetical protein AVEN_237045-1 [Araneus ventricosus]GBN77411.1 hypothetical protein AVEN_33587-1 [Araneus ventricosus]